MSESNYNWVCFECRSALRQAKTFDNIPKCNFCQRDCVCIGYKLELPRKKDIKGWKKLQQTYQEIRLNQIEEKKAAKDFRISHLKKEIQKLSRKADNKDRNRLINSMKEELEKKMNEAAG